MPSIDRRTLLCGVAAAVLATATRTQSAMADTARGKLPAGRVPPPVGLLTRLPGDGNQLALTVDDGTSVAVVGAFAQFCRDTGTRLTFFVNGVNSSWTVNAPALRPMVDSGQIQLGNHTWSHPNITHIDAATVTEQIQRNADFLRNTYGVDGTPYFRPPYGSHNTSTDRIAAQQGYSTITTWSGTIGDSLPEDEAHLIANAQTSFQPQQIILAHANLPTITHCYDQLLDIITTRNLQTVTLNDVFG
jgi:peptidoglycan/xylan/chitin deacetylase (PgdA/CDA1 family)